VLLVLTYAWSLPGTPLLPQLGVYSPTAAGLDAGAWRAGRLLLMLAGVAVLLATTPGARLVYGLYALAAPLAWFGLDRRAFAVRLGLTLAEVGAERAALSPQDLRERLQACAREQAQVSSVETVDALAQGVPRCVGMTPAVDSPDVFVLPAEDWRVRDAALLIAAVGFLGWALA
jgi:hypothetical protein